MSFDRPILSLLRQRIANDLVDKLPGANARLRVNNLRAFSEVEAGIAHLLYGRIDWSFRQLFPDTAEREFLDRWASIWGIPRIPATAARGVAVWAAEAGATVPAGAIVRRADGVQYRSEAGGVESNGAVALDLICETFGAAGNADPGTLLNLTTTATGVAVQGQVDEPGIAGGADEQSDASLLQAVLMRIQLPPHGGAAFDYIRWALEVPGVTRAWVYPMELGPGTVTVRFMMDQVRADAGGIPTPADVAAVQQHIDGVRPVTARVIVAAPVALPIQVAISQLAADTPTVRQGIEANIRNMLLQEAEPGGTIYVSQISTAIGLVPDVRHFVLDQPTAQITPAVGEIVMLDGVSYS